jgi:hypothetical protein
VRRGAGTARLAGQGPPRALAGLLARLPGRSWAASGRRGGWSAAAMIHRDRARSPRSLGADAGRPISKAVGKSLRGLGLSGKAALTSA